jgi:CHAT domain-containing protein
VETAVGDWSKAIAKALARVHDLVMGPVGRKLTELAVPEGSHIVIMAPGSLSILPLHAARNRTSANKWHYFLDEWTVSYVPTLQTLVESKRRSREPDRQGASLLAITDPNRDLGRPINPAWRLFEGKRRLGLDGGAATVQKVKQELPGWNYLSFYCHGTWDSVKPEESGLVLAGNETLTMGELRQLDLGSSRLAVLGACETGLITVTEAPDEFLGLPAGLIEAGVPGVVASLWLVELDATKRIVERLLEVHLDGADPADALRQTQREFRDSGSPADIDNPLSSANPFFWAAFAVTGA